MVDARKQRRAPIEHLIRGVVCESDRAASRESGGRGSNKQEKVGDVGVKRRSASSGTPALTTTNTWLRRIRSRSLLDTIQAPFLYRHELTVYDEIKLVPKLLRKLVISLRIHTGLFLGGQVRGRVFATRKLWNSE